MAQLTQMSGLVSDDIKHMLMSQIKRSSWEEITCVSILDPYIRLKVTAA